MATHVVTVLFTDVADPDLSPAPLSLAAERDGVVALYASAVDAASAAVRLVAHSQHRAGLDVAELESGTAQIPDAVIVAVAALCRGAADGELLASALAADLVSSRGTFEVGEDRTVEWPGGALDARVLRSATARLTTEPRFLGRGAELFVGRGDELDRLERALEAARLGPQLAVITGDAGVGKTELVRRFARRAFARGAEISVGRCDEHNLLAALPFVEVAGQLAVALPATDLESLADEYGTALSHLVPQISVPATDREPANPGARRQRTFEAAIALVERATRTAQLVVVLEDLHWADRPTLLLLRSLLDSGVPILVVATSRTGLPDLADVAAVSIELSGLRVEDVDELVGVIIGDELGAFGRALSERVHGMSDGNAFFAVEVARQLRDDSVELSGLRAAWRVSRSVGQLRVPESVRELVQHRVSRLSEDASYALTVGSVIGPEFTAGLVASVSDLPPVTVDDAINEALQHRLIEPAEDAAAYRFAHDLLRDVLYDQISRARRARLHAAAGAAVEDEPSEGSMRCGEIVGHYARAGDSKLLPKVVEYGRRAGDDAVAGIAYEAAATYYTMALGALSAGEPANQTGRADLQLRLAVAQTGSGAARAAMDNSQEAAAIATELKDAALLSRAALVFDEAHWVGASFGVDPASQPVADLVSRALDALPAEDSRRGALLAALPRSAYFTSSQAEKLDWAGRALDLAEPQADPLVLWAALDAKRWAAWGPDDLSGQLALAERMLGVAEDVGDRGLVFRSAAWRLTTLLELGRLADVDEQAAILEGLAERSRHPFERWWVTAFRSTRAFMARDLDVSNEEAREALRLGRAMQVDWAIDNFRVQLYTLMRERGEAATLVDGVREVVARYPRIPVWRCGLASILANAGDTAGARAEVEILAAAGFAQLPHDYTWLMAMHELAEAVTVIGDSARAEVLYEMLLPYAAQHVVVSMAIAYEGPVSRSLGRLATTSGRLDDANRHFADASRLELRA